jgi:hypothetical protein
MYAMQAKIPSRTPLRTCCVEERRMYADRGYVEMFKSHRVERGRDVVLRRLQGRSLLLFFRRPYEEVGVSCVGGVGLGGVQV